MHVRQETTYLGAIPVLSVFGDVDMTTSGPITTRLGSLLRDQPPALVVDLSKVLFFGSEGIRTLIEANTEADRLGVRFGVVANHSRVLRPLEVTAVDRVLPMFPDLDGAVAALGRS